MSAKAGPGERPMQDAVLLADVREVEAVLPKLFAATEAGELDGHINAVTKAKQPTVMKPG